MSKQTKLLVTENTPMDLFENAIREVGVVAACEWFGYSADSDFTKETALVLDERSAIANQEALKCPKT